MTKFTSPTEYYLRQVNDNNLIKDDDQLLILKSLDAIHLQLIQELKKRKSRVAFLRKIKTIHGLYLWGEVGVGKTFLMDCFFKTLPFNEKKRIHFHAFMHFIHQQLKIYQGKKNPLKIIANDLAKKNIVLCFDEFIVTDITDAMLLARLFDGLIQAGLCIVATSNVHPNDLYKNGLQRGLFLPTIALLKTNLAVIHLPTFKDYRLYNLKHAHAFHTPNNAISDRAMKQIFDLLTLNKEVNYDPIILNGRSISIIKSTDDVIWFDYKQILTKPRSQLDYISLSKQYHTVFISNVPSIPFSKNDEILLLIRLVDVFYDAHIRLVLSAATPINQIYQSGPMLFEFKRTISRLVEMQSEKYFAIKM